MSMLMLIAILLGLTAVYGIPPEQVVGSSIVSGYQVIDGKGVIVHKPASYLYSCG